MSDLISKSALLASTDKEEIHKYEIALFPTIETKKGKWIYHDPLDVFECSVCGRQMVRNIFNYCPWCGAKMERSEE